MKKRIKTPEVLFLEQLQQREQRCFTLVKALGVVVALSIITQAFGLAHVLAALVLERRLPLESALLAGGAFLIKALAQFGREQLSAQASRNYAFPCASV